jgi:chromosome segregation ATPase
VGISVDEQVEIIGQINDVIRRNRIQIHEDTFSFRPRKEGSFIPILVGVAALAVTLIAAALMLYFYDRSERHLMARSSAVLSVEGKVLAAFKKESAEQLGAKDRQILETQARLEELARERDQLKLATQDQIRRREAELEAELDRQLAEQRQKLEREGLGPAAVERKLKDLESRLAEANQRQIAAFRKQTDEQLAAKDASLATMARQYTESLEAFQRERTALEERLEKREAELQAQLREQTAAAESARTAAAGELAQLRSQREKERLFFQQLESGYEKVRGDLKQAQYDLAEKDLDKVQELLSQESVLSLPAIRGRLPLELFTIDSLRRLVAFERAGSQAETEGERRKLEEELRQARDDLNRLSQEVARYQAEAKRRASLEAQLQAMQERYAEAGKRGSASSQSKVLALLETKLNIREILSSEPVKNLHPGLDEQLEKYLDAFGREQRQEGQSAALSDTLTVLDTLKKGKLDLRRLKGDYSGALGDLFARFLEKLRGLLR